MRIQINFKVIYFSILILFISNLMVKGQSIYLEKQLVLSDIFPNHEDYILSPIKKITGESKLEIQISGKDVFDITSILIDFETQTVTNRITENSIEYDLSSFAKYPIYPISFKGESNFEMVYSILFENIRIYNPIVDDVKLDNTSISGRCIVSDINLDGYPEIIGYPNFENRVEVFTYNNRCSPNHIFGLDMEVKQVLLAQMDTDVQLEILVLGFFSSLIVDPFTSEVEEIDLPANNPESVTSFNEAGVNKILFLNGANRLIIYNTETKVSEISKTFETSFVDGNIAQFHTIDDTGKEDTYFILLNDKLVILDNELNIISELDDLELDSNDDVVREIIVHDSDGDYLPNILFKHGDFISNYEISGVGNYYEPFQITDQYPQEDQAISKKTPMMIEFNSTVELDTLIKYIKLTNINSGNDLEFNLETTNNLNFIIYPVNDLPSGSYSLVILEGLRSTLNERLDINKDRYIGLDDLTNYSIQFVVQNIFNPPDPSVQILTSIPDSLYENSKFKIDIEVNSNRIGVPIKSVQHGYRNEPLQDILPYDKVYNDQTELCEFYIDTGNKDEGTFLYVIKFETYEGTVDSTVFPIRIVDVYGHPLPLPGVNINYNNYQERDEFNNIFKYIWSTPSELAWRDYIVGENGFMYFGDENELVLKKVNTLTNELQWEVDLTAKPLSRLSMSHGSVFFASKDNSYITVHCYDSSNGQPKWESLLVDQSVSSGIIPHPLLVHKDYVFLTDQNGIYCLNRWTGEVLWHRLLDKHIRSNMVIYNDIIYAADSYNIYALNISNGTSIFENEDNSQITFGANFVIDIQNKQLIYINTDEIVACDLLDLERNWSKPHQGHKTIAARNNTLYVTGSYDSLRILDLDTGIFRDEFIDPTPSIPRTDIFLFGDVLVVSDQNRGTSFYDADDLSFLSKIEDDGVISLIDDVLLLNNNNIITAYKMQDNCYVEEYYSDSICNNDSLYLGGNYYFESGYYQDTIIGMDSCHTIINLNLEIIEMYLSDSTIMHDTGITDGSIEIEVGGGTPPYEYQWSNNEITSNIYNLEAGTYTLTVTDSQFCIKDLFFQIEDYKCINQGGDDDNDGSCADVDCDDQNPNINPGQIETPYNGVDDDCDSLTLDDDLDQDGFLLDDDCDDQNPNINPDQIETPYNDVDDDCDSLTLDDDLDQDGFLLDDDCDDQNPNINPDQIETPYNGVDDDCDSLTLDDDLDQDGFLLDNDCDDQNPNINPDQIETPYNGVDDDCDSLTLDDDLDQDGFLLDNDCDDQNPNINPDAEEIPDNGIDENCDGMDLISSTYEILNSTVNIYPNPTKDIINIDITGELKILSNFYNSDGKLILSELNSTQIKVGLFPTGIYLLEIIDLKSGKSIVDKIVVAK